MKTRFSTTALLCGIALFAAGTVQAAQPIPQAAVQVDTLLQSSTSWDGTSYTAYPNGKPELTVLKITIPAHTKLPWHTHPMPNAAYVLSGELTVETKLTGQKTVVTEGQVLPEMVNIVHRGVTGEKPVALIVFYAGTEGMHLSHKHAQP